MYKKLFFLILFPILILAQEQPKVGLVLSGGGAKGFAHIGVLKELEKTGLQLDYIGGTSMGAIVASMYAAGYNATQIEELIKEADFASLIQDKIPRREKPYFEKNFLEKHAFTLPIKDWKLSLPLGLSKGQNALNLLTEVFSPVEHISDFSKLPIPFYCVATDIEKGKEVVLEKGSIPLAIRASASFPTLLNPIDKDGKLLVDGGVVNNFPVDIMKEKDVDIIIGVNVEGELSKKEDLTSIKSVLEQIINFQMYAKSTSQIEKVNVYLRPNVNDYTVTSFDKIDEIIAQGNKEAASFSAVFKKIAAQQKIKKPKKNLAIEDKKFLIDRIVLKGNKNYTRNYILGKIHLKEGDSVSYKGVSAKVSTLTATNNFKRIDYSLAKSFKGKKLELELKEGEIKSFLNIGFHYDQLYESAVLLNYNHKNLFFSNDEVSLDIIVGDNFRYNFEYFIDNGILPSYGFSSRFNTFSENLFFNLQNENVNKINLRYRDFSNSIFTQTILDEKFGFGFGLEFKQLTAKTETILTNNNETFFENSNYFSSFAFLNLDTFDKKTFPTKGFYADFNFKWFMASDRNNIVDKLAEGSEPFSQFSQIDGTISSAYTIGKFTFQYVIEAGYTLGEEKSQIFDYRLGGYNKNTINNFKPFYGYEYGALTGQSFLKGELDFRYEVFNNNYVSFIANLVRAEEDVFGIQSLFGGRRTGYGIGYSLDTFLGPIELKYTWSPDHDENFLLFNLGFWF